MLAKLAEASETFIWRDSSRTFSAFSGQIAELDLILIQDGRFWHVLDKRGGKGQALHQLYQQRSGTAYITIGSGMARTTPHCSITLILR